MRGLGQLLWLRLTFSKSEYGLEIYVLSSWVDFVVLVLKIFGPTQPRPLAQGMKMGRVSRDISPRHPQHPNSLSH